MLTKVINDEADLKRFQQGYYQASGVLVDLNFLKRASIVRGIYERYPQMVGGYIINSNKPFRYLSDIPEGKILKKTVPLEGELAEGCCIWMKEYLSSWQRGWVYTLSVYDFFMLGKRYMMAGTTKQAIARLQMKALPEVLYEGAIEGAPWAKMYYGKRRHMVWLLFFIVLNYWFVNPIKNVFKSIKRRMYGSTL